jgi:chromosome partitioning protein
MLQEGLAESAEAASSLRRLLPEEMVFKTAVPREDIFIRASAKGLPVGVLEGGASAEALFDSLRSEVQTKLTRYRNASPYQQL